MPERKPTSVYTIRSIERYRRLSRGLPVPVIRHKGLNPPCGYKLDPNNKFSYIVDEEKFNLLIQARHYLRESSYRDVADWLTKKGLKISFKGLQKLMKNRPPLTYDERRRYSASGEE